jgi:hypothetical protein
VSRSGVASRGDVWHGNHHRLGTEADQRGRGGMCFGESGSRRLRFVQFADGQGSSMQGKLRPVVETKLVQARGRINAGGLGCTSAWCGGMMLSMARPGEVWVFG